MARFRARSGRQTGKRRMDWTGAAVDGFGTLAANVTGAAYLLLPSQALAFTDPTLVRIRGHFVAGGQIVAGLLADYNGAAGVISWDDQDDTIPPVADRPDPWNRPDLDWIWHTYLFGLGGSNLADAGGNRAERHVIDSRAMRRLGTGKGLLFCVHNGSAANDLIYSWGARCLLKE